MTAKKKKKKKKTGRTPAVDNSKVKSFLVTADRLFAENRVAEAENFLKKALRMRPGSLETLGRLTSVYERMKDFDKALDIIDKALELDSSAVWFYGASTRIYKETEDLDKALEAACRGLEIQPDNYLLLSLRGDVHKQMGDLDKARSFFGKALELNGNCIEAVAGLAELNKARKDSREFTILENALKNEKISGELYMRLNFVLGKMYNDTGDYEKAFARYRAGNDMRDKHYSEKFDLEAYRKNIDDSISLVTSDFINSRKKDGIFTRLPVFIIGMPRSGTTLTEQIIASHPVAEGVGELADIRLIYQRLWKKYIDTEKGEDLSHFISRVQPDDIKEAAEEYLETIKAKAPGAERIVDKMPGNYHYLWFIRIMFPDACVIHCRRNPVDTCLSIYFQNFGPAHPYKTNLVRLGLYYKEYEKVISDWRNKADRARFMELDYEDTVENQEAVSKRLINFCGLPWDEKCLEFYKSSRMVKTASFAQVKRKIYKSSAGRWKNYSPYIGPILEALQIERR